MLRKIACLVGCASANAMGNLQDIPILLNTMDIEGTRAQLTQLKGIQAGLMDGKMLLQNNIDPATVAVAMTVVDKVGDFVGAAVKWIDESSDKAADVERITAAMDVVRGNRVTLVQYSEELLDKSIKALSLSAHQVYGAMQHVKSMAKIVKVKAVDTLEWMEAIDELDDPTDIRETWAVTVQELTNVLTETHTRTSQIYAALDTTLNTMVKMRSTIDSMVERTTINIQAEESRLADELAEAEANLASYKGGCFSSVGEAFKTIFSLGISCLARDAAKRKTERMKTMIAKQYKDYGTSITPLVGKLAGVGEAARLLLDASYTKFEKIGDFMDSLLQAKMYFSSAAAQGMSNKQQTKHVKKLKELIEACDIMLYHSEHNMEIFKAINTNTKSITDGAAAFNAQTKKNTQAELDKISAQEDAEFEREKAKLEAQLKKMQDEGRISLNQLVDLRLLKEGIIQGPQFLV